MRAEHAHRWRVVAFERASQLVAYRCPECGEEKFSRPELERTPTTAERDFQEFEEPRR